ncbi:MAG: hypothetical protein IKI94_01030 [Ruminococcus sp.]|nr:hypothetical protein [Ruminococcus sp.]
MKLCRLFCAGVVSLLLVGCYPVRYHNSSSSDESSAPKSSARIFLEEELEKKYGMDFEILGGGSVGLLSVAQDCDVRCVEDGIEFEATLHTKDYYEVVSENYLRHKYLPQVQEDIEAYLKKYLSDFKFVEIRANDKELPFNTSPNLTYEELKQHTDFTCDVYISDQRIFSNEEMSLLFEKFASATTLPTDETDTTIKFYKDELNMKVKFYIYTVPQEVYDEIEYCRKWYDRWVPGYELLID